jgi:nucleotide-binding universal stress UspA family protein
MKLKTILVALRGNSADEHAVILACDLAKRPRAKIYVVYVIEVKRSLPLDAVTGEDVQKAEAVLTLAEDTASEQDYEVETDLVQAREAGPAIIAQVSERKADMIIIGVSYKHSYGKFSLGSVVPYVLQEAPCRVLVSREARNKESE